MLIIERFENDTAVIETQDGCVNIPRSSLPTDAREGDVIAETGDGRYVTDSDMTEKRRREMADLQSSMWE